MLSDSSEQTFDKAQNKVQNKAQRKTLSGKEYVKLLYKPEV